MDKIVFYSFACSVYKRILIKNHSNIKLPENIENNIIQEISKLSLKPLMLLMAVYIDNGVISGKTSNKKYEEFDRYSTCNDFFDVIDACYPELIKKISYMITSKITGYLDLVERFENDKKQIKRELGFDADSISYCKIHAGLSDMHDGKENHILEYNGKKIVYKTRDSYNDLFWNGIINWVNGKSSYNLLFGVRTLNKQTYSWHEYISYSELHLEDKVQEYYYKIGCISFLAYLFDMTDLHMENIICSNKGPIVVDTETICQVIVDNKKYNKELSYFDGLLSGSLIKTELFPASIWTNKRKIDTSGICGSGGQIVEGGKLELEFPYSDKMNLNIVDGILESSNNNPKINGEFVNPKKYEKFVEKGFKETYDIFLNNKEEFTQYIEENEDLKKANIRVVFHDTQLYQDIIDFSTIPSNLTRHGLNRIYRIIEDLCEDKKEVLIEDIFKNLIVGNIPIYFGKVESKYVKTSTGEVCYEHNRKPISQVLNKIEKLSLRDMEFQRKLIELSLLNFREKYRNKEFSIKNTSKKNKPIKSSTIEKEVKMIVDKIRNRAFLSKNGYINWITIENNYPNWNIKFQDCSLYSGLSGNAILFAGCYKTFGDKEYLEVLLRILKTIEKRLEIEEKSSSIFNGSLAVAYLYFFLYKQGFGETYYKKGVELVTQHERQILDNNDYDLLDGISGVLIILIQSYELQKDSYLLNLINKASDKLLDLISIENDKTTWKGEAMLTGLAHGVAGVSYALIKLYELTGLTKYKNLAKNLVGYENFNFNREEGNWTDIVVDGKISREDTVIQWCHGAVGIGLARLKTNRTLNNMVDIDRALKAVIKMGMYKENDSICHGNIGNLSFLIEYYNQFKDEDIKDIIIYRLNEVLLENSGKYKSGLAKDFESVDFMSGLSGIGYEYLRLINKSLPLVSLLEM